MGIIGGKLGYNLLRALNTSGENLRLNGSAYTNKSKLETLLGAQIWRTIADKVVIDFGCGEGYDSIEMAEHGAQRVIGIDIQERFLARARALAETRGLSARCRFLQQPDELADIIISLDSFEHFDNPLNVLITMRAMLKPGGYVLTAFGPTWYHPLGGHLFSIFPWAHLVFTERALIRWRADFTNDGATCFRECQGGLNRMTIRRFESLVAASPLRFARFETVPIRKLKPFANRLTREVTTAMVRCKLIARA